MDSDQKIPGVGSSLLVRAADHFLLMRRATSHGFGTWAAPGGFLDFGESPEECAMRELKEETRLVVDQVSFITFTNDRFEDSGKHDITLWFEAEHDMKDLAPTDEASELRWFKTGEFPEPLFLPLDNFLKKISLR